MFSTLYTLDPTPQSLDPADGILEPGSRNLKQNLRILDASFRVLSPGASTLHHEPYKQVEAFCTLDQAAEQMHQILNIDYNCLTSPFGSCKREMLHWSPNDKQAICQQYVSFANRLPHAMCEYHVYFGAFRRLSSVQIRLTSGRIGKSLCR